MKCSAVCHVLMMKPQLSICFLQFSLERNKDLTFIMIIIHIVIFFGPTIFALVNSTHIFRKMFYMIEMFLYLDLCVVVSSWSSDVMKVIIHKDNGSSPLWMRDFRWWSVIRTPDTHLMTQNTLDSSGLWLFTLDN